MNKEEFEKLRVPGEILWEDACVIWDAIIEHKPETVLELGCFRGLSTLVILDALKEVFGTECMEISEHLYVKWAFTSIDIVPMGALFNLKDTKHARRAELVPSCAPVTHIVSDALKFLNGIRSECVDLIFEDTTHQTAYTRQLIPEILRVLKPDGVALFHDLKLITMQLAFKKEGLKKKLKLFPPSWMGQLRKENGVLV